MMPTVQNTINFPVWFFANHIEEKSGFRVRRKQECFQFSTWKIRCEKNFISNQVGLSIYSLCIIISEMKIKRF